MMDCNDDKVLISQVPLKRMIVLSEQSYKDEWGWWRKPMRIYYDCPVCNLQTYIEVDKSDELVPENVAAGTVPPEPLTGEVRLCGTCENATWEIN